MKRSSQSPILFQGAVEMAAGILAPLLWSCLHYLLFGNPAVSTWQQISHTLWGTPQHITLSIFLMACASISFMVAAIHSDLWQNRAHERQQAISKLEQELEHRSHELNTQALELNQQMKRFHQTNAHLQQSLDRREIMTLAADSLKDILGYDRINVLMLTEDGKALEFMASLGTGEEQICGTTFPLSPEAGVIFLAMQQKSQPLLVDDIRELPAEYHLRPPWDNLNQLRSRSFIICPIVVDGRAIGIFGVDNKHKKTTLDEGDLDTVRIFAEQVAAAISKIDLLQAVELLTVEIQRTFAQSLKHRDRMGSLVNEVKHDTQSATATICQLGNASEALHQTVDETGSAATEMSTAVQQVSDNLLRLNELMHQAITATKEISAATREVAEHASISHEMAMTVQHDADQGVEKVAGAHQLLMKISTATMDTSQAFEALTEKTDNIEHFLSLINEINRKTKLLSLNASIIAAQAGEQGKTFAVVAEEIQALFNETSQASLSIEMLINEVRQLTEDANRQLGQTSSLVREGVAFGQTTAKTLSQISQSATQALEVTKKINHASKDQSTNAEMSAASIQEMGQIADMVATASREQAGAILRIAGQVEETEVMASHMTSATGQQQESITHIDNMMEQVRDLATQIFSEISNRQSESAAVITRMKQLKGEKNTASPNTLPINLLDRQRSTKLAGETPDSYSCFSQG